MMFAKDFRTKARQALAGNWKTAVGVGFVATLLGVNDVNANINININTPELYRGTLSFLYFRLFLLLALIFVVVYFLVSSFVGVGYAKFNLNLVNKKELGIRSLFSYRTYWTTTAATSFLKLLFTFLWTLLFIIPGIVASLSYSMTDFILAEEPQLTASQAIEKSKQMMYGNRWRLFCLEFSFIGWELLAILSFGIGFLWLIPYKKAAFAEFYYDVSKEKRPE